MTSPPADRLRRLAADATPAPWYEPGVYQGLRHLDRNCDWYYDQLPGPQDEGVTIVEYQLPDRDDARLIALAPEMALLLADMTEALASYDHSDDDCQGECVPGTRKQIYERDFAPLVARLAALAPEETT